ncbi:copper transporter [Ornithinimicrobium sp. W1679]|uniref:copper transporter n=1 Tax=Ornithinimicrobium sp. W1679 TaxID=3418770 RepID=UPI003CE6F46E
MIDFRYHLVSLVAVFIALAVGIVLGAGPLREGLSSTLEGEVSQLREERVALRADVDEARRLAEAREQALHRTGTRAVAGTLTGTRVGLVVLPGADREPLDDLAERLEDAGAQVAVTVDVDARWDVSPLPEDRAELLQRLAGGLAVPQIGEAEGPGVPTVLAAALAGADQDGQLGAWLVALDDLSGADLVDVTWEEDDEETERDRRPPDAVVVLAGGLDPAAVGATPGDAGAEALAHRLDLLSALAELEMPTVVTGTGTDSRPALGPDGGAEDGLDVLLAVVRQDRELGGEVSTVDNTEGVSGRLAAVLALAWETRDRAGHYGLGRLAQAPVPVAPPVRNELEVGVPGTGELGVVPAPASDTVSPPDPGVAPGTTPTGPDVGVQETSPP